MFFTLQFTLAVILAIASGELSPDIMSPIPLLSLDEIRSAEDEDAVRRAVRWTTEDIAPFYTTLAWVAARPPGELTASSEPVPSRDLFLKPELQRQKSILLKGVVKQIVEINCSEAVFAEFGIARYYQLALFSPDADGNPIIVCVASLPANIAPGDSLEISVQLAAIYYKPWLYESREGKVHLAPLLIGGDATWLPDPEIIGRDRNVQWSLVLFSVCGGAWIVVRLVMGLRGMKSTRVSDEVRDVWREL